MKRLVSILFAFALIAGCGKYTPLKERLYMSSTHLYFPSEASTDSIYSKGSGIRSLFIYLEGATNEGSDLVSSSAYDWLKVSTRREKRSVPYYVVKVEVAKNETGRERELKFRVSSYETSCGKPADITVTQNP